MPAKNKVLAAVMPIDSEELMALPHQQKVVLVMDLVESVRLMAANELAVIDQWRGFVRHATTSVLPKYEGRLVKSLGDGIMVEFESPRNATNAAAQLHRYFDSVNAALPPGQKLYLRAGLNMARIYVDDIDIYGSGVNLAARVASLAGPGETMVTAEVRDGLTDGLDAKIEDMGECYLKHVAEPVRSFRVGEAGPKPTLIPVRDHVTPLQPTIAVIPFAATHIDSDNAHALGDAVADNIIGALSQSVNLRVISRLSTTHFRAGSAQLDDIHRLLGANYVVTGSYSTKGQKACIHVQLCDARNGLALWSETMTVIVSDLFHGQDKIIPEIAKNVGQIILKKELDRSHSLPLNTLDTYTLFLSGTTKLHRSSLGDFLSARCLLEHLCARHPKLTAPQAMLAKWYLVRVLQGWSTDVKKDSISAFKFAQQALACDSGNAFAMATDGFLTAYFNGNPEAAVDRCQAAVQVDPQDASALRMLACVKSYMGDGEASQACALQAMSLTPLDPHLYIFELVVGASKLLLGQYDDALVWANKSLQGNVMHVPTHRLRTMALSMAGNQLEAKRAGARMLQLNPGFRISQFAANYPGRNYPHARHYLKALRQAGLPD